MSYNKIIRKLAEDSLPCKQMKNYKLKINITHTNVKGAVDVKLFYKDKLVKRIRESNKYTCSKCDHKLLRDIGVNIFWYENELNW